MKPKRIESNGCVGDRPAVAVSLSTPRPVGLGFRRYERFRISRSDRCGVQETFDRDLLRSGAVVGILPVDLARDEVVLTRQFRLGGHLATGRGEMIEIAAGKVDDGETIEDAARRECREETGLDPLQIACLFGFSPAPALSDEFMTLFLAEVDAASVPAWAGAAHENEEIEVISHRISHAVELIERNALQSGPTLIALQWLSLNRGSLNTLLNTRYRSRLPDQ